MLRAKILSFLEQGQEEALRAVDVGQQLPAELRCTCKGGICATPTGMRLQTWMDGMRESERKNDLGNAK